MKKASVTPPMGWNSWDCYGAAVNEEQLLGNARYMAENLKQYGWEYIVCDIEWSEPTAKSTHYNNFADLCMDEYSRLIPAENRFPSSAGGRGFKPIADEVHSLGLKFGIHILRGIPRQAVHRNTPTVTGGVTARDIAQSYSVCPWNTGMYGVDYNKKGAQEYYNSIFELYASWGVDFVKVDDISNTEFRPSDPYSARKEIEMIRAAIENCGRDMVLSLSPGPAPLWEHEHLAEYADMWRMSGDFWDNSGALDRMFGLCYNWNPYRAEGAWPDCDMLPLGRLCMNDPDENARARQTRFTESEQGMVMDLWCIFRSPLMFGGEMRLNDEKTLKLITNAEKLDICRYSTDNRPLEEPSAQARWVCKDRNGRNVTALFNLGYENDAEIEVPENMAGMKVHRAGETEPFTLTETVKLAPRTSIMLVED